MVGVAVNVVVGDGVVVPVVVWVIVGVTVGVDVFVELETLTACLRIHSSPLTLRYGSFAVLFLLSSATTVPPSAEQPYSVKL